MKRAFFTLFALALLSSAHAAIPVPAWTNHNRIAGNQEMMTNFKSWAVGVGSAVASTYTKSEADAKFAPATYTGNYRYLMQSMYNPGYYEWAASSGSNMPLFGFEGVTYEEYPGPDYTYYNVYGGDMLFGVNAGIYNYSTPHYSASTAIGHSATVYTREYASDGCLAFGAGAMANGDAAIAIGNKALAGDMSMMSGSWASGQTAIGFQTTAFGGYSTALGFNTMAYGEGSVAIGYGARVGDYSYGSDSGYHSICISAGGYSYVYGSYEIHFNTGYGGNLSRIYFDGTSLDWLVNTKITSKGYVTTAQLNTKAAEINANVERVRKTIAAELKIVEMADGFHIVKIEEDL